MSWCDSLVGSCKTNESGILMTIILMKLSCQPVWSIGRLSVDLCPLCCCQGCQMACGSPSLLSSCWYSCLGSRSPDWRRSPPDYQLWSRENGLVWCTVTESNRWTVSNPSQLLFLCINGLSACSQPHASRSILRNAPWVILLSLTSLAGARKPSRSYLLEVQCHLSPFPDCIQTSPCIFPQFYHVTNCTRWHGPWVTFSMFPLTHSAVAAGSKQQRGGDACALDRSHSALSGDAPSASSSHPLFGTRTAAETRSTPSEARERTESATNSCMEDAFCCFKVCWELKKNSYLQTEALQHFLDSGLMPISACFLVCIGALLWEHVHINKLKIPYLAIQLAGPRSHRRFGNDVNHISYLKKSLIAFIRLRWRRKNSGMATYYFCST